MDGNDIIEFYRRIIFGKNYKKIKNKDPHEIKKICFLTAWNDMAMHQTNIVNKYNNLAAAIGFTLKINKDKIINREDFIGKVFDLSVNELNRVLDNGEKSKDIIKKLHKNVFHNCFEIGKVQKIVNMYYKYLFTFCLDSSTANINSVFSKYDSTNFAGCDCPIDNYILNAMEKNGLIDKQQRKACVWSQMDEPTYNDYQNKIRNHIKSNEIPLDFDFKNFG